jgi:parallel beta-helix repeat protein
MKKHLSILQYPTKTIFYLLIFALFVLSFSIWFIPGAGNDETSATRCSPFKQPLYFEKNLGQTDCIADFYYRDRQYNFFLSSTGSLIDFHNKDKAGPQIALQMELIESNRHTRAEGRGLALSKSNYFIGNNPDRWISNVPHYTGVEYKNVYPNIDLVYYFNQNKIEFDFVIHPGADPHDIGLLFSGMQQCEKDKAGNLVLISNDHKLIYQKPLAWQEIDGRKNIIGAQFALLDNQVRFDLDAYNAAEKLIIDPKITYATYLGGDSYDTASGIAIDSEGCAYVTGSTSSLDFPVADAYQTRKKEGSSQYSIDAFITKFNADGSDIIYSTYIGGNGEDNPEAIVVDSNGNACIAGRTTSYDRPDTPDYEGLPVHNAYQAEFGGGTRGMWEAFVTVLSADGSSLVYSTFLGGKNDDQASDIDVDPSDCVYVTGTTFSSGFPSKNAWMPENSSYHFDAFAAKLDPSQSGENSLIYSTYIGGNLDDYGNSIAVDNQGHAHITGYAHSTDFPTTPNPIQNNKKGTTDAFITKLSADGKSAVYSTYLGGNTGDQGIDMDTDNAGNAYLYLSGSEGIPVTSEPFAQPTGRFLCKLPPNGSGFIYSIPVPARGWKIAVDDSGQVYIASYLNNDAHVFALNAQGTDSLFTFTFGGSDDDGCTDIAVDKAHNLYITGNTKSRDFPVKNAFQAEYGEDPSSAVRRDAFVVKLAMEIKPVLQVSPDPIVFPLTLPGDIAKKTVQVTNPSEEEIEITNIDIEPASQFSLENQPNLPLTLREEELIDFQVVYAPGGLAKSNSTQASMGTGALTIVNDGEVPFLSVPIEAKGIIVNDPGDASDYDLLDGICDTDAVKPGNQCTFRAAIENVNAMQDDNVTRVYVRIPGQSNAEIKPTRPLPAIEYPIRFEIPEEETVILNGRNAGNTDGLDIRSGYCFLQNLIFTNWNGHGVKISGGEWNYIQQCTFKNNVLSEDQQVAGVWIEQSPSNTIRNNIIYGNRRYGIYISGESSNLNVIEECTIGYDNNDSPGSALQRIGIYIRGGTENKIRHNKIGNHDLAAVEINACAKTLIEHNLILKNKYIGIKISDSSSETEIRNNKIGCDANGQEEAPNHSGIVITHGATDTHVHHNLISGNSRYGLRIGSLAGDGGTVSNSIIEKNIIGLDKNGKVILSNETGISLTGECKGNKIQKNTISGNRVDGIFVRNNGNNWNNITDNFIGTDSSGTLPVSYMLTGIRIRNSAGIVIMGNTISCNLHHQIYLSKVDIGNNHILSNNIGTNRKGESFSSGSQSSSADGIYSYDANTFITGNLIKDQDAGIKCLDGSDGYMRSNTIRNNQLGVEIVKSPMEVFMNHIFANGEGIKVDDVEQRRVIIVGNEIHNNLQPNTGIQLTNAGATVVGNSIYGDAGDGIVVAGSSDPVIHKNNIMDNNGYGLHHKGSVPAVNARNNWWGAANGPSGSGSGNGDNVSTGVDFGNWRNSKVSLFVYPENDTTLLYTGLLSPVALFFQNWNTANDKVKFRATSDKPWLYTTEEKTVSLEQEWGGRSQLLFSVPDGTPAGSIAHIEVNATSTVDGSSDKARFVVIAGSMALSAISITPDSAIIAPGDTVRFSAQGYNPFSRRIDIQPRWMCTGGSIDQSGQFIAGDETGLFQVMVIDIESGITARTDVRIGWPTRVENGNDTVTSRFQLYQNYPNPFNPVTHIPYSIPERGHVIIRVYNMRGRHVCTLVDQVQPPGQYLSSWKGVDDDKKAVSAGLYIYHLTTNHMQQSRKMLLLK